MHDPMGSCQGGWAAYRHAHATLRGREAQPGAKVGVASKDPSGPLVGGRHPYPEGALAAEEAPLHSVMAERGGEGSTLGKEGMGGEGGAKGPWVGARLGAKERQEAVRAPDPAGAEVAHRNMPGGKGEGAQRLGKAGVHEA